MVAMTTIALPSLINEDVPTAYTLKLEDAVNVPRVGLQSLHHFVRILGTYNEHGPAFIFERATHDDEAFSDSIDKPIVLIPKRLLTCAFGQITPRSGNRQHCKGVTHASHPFLRGTLAHPYPTARSLFNKSSTSRFDSSDKP